jgi:hypothetical protein
MDRGSKTEEHVIVSRCVAKRGRKKMAQYHLYDGQRTQTFREKRLAELVTAAERELNPFAGWRQKLLDAINEPPRGGKQYVIVRCGNRRCHGNTEPHLGVAEKYYLAGYAMALPDKKTEIEYAERYGIARTRAYHYGRVDNQVKRSMRQRHSWRREDIIYDAAQMTENWLDVTDYVAFAQKIDQITIIACTTPGCDRMKRHTRVEILLLKTMEEAVKRDKLARWIDNDSEGDEEYEDNDA